MTDPPADSVNDVRSRRLAEIRARLDTPLAQLELRRFQARCGRFGEIERRQVLAESETADSGNASVGYTVKGHAAVFDRKSLELGDMFGIFREVIAPTAFDDVLDRNPDVHLLWDHDTSLALARTNRSPYLLELRTDPKGLHYYAKVAPTTFANDLRILMESGVIDQASFAFTVEDDTWEIKNEGKANETVIRTIVKVRDLYDVTITAQGAYPQTDSTVVRAYAFDYAVSTGRLEQATDTEEGPLTEDEARTREELLSITVPDAADQGAEHSEDVAPDEPVGAEETPSRDDAGGDSQRTNPVLRATRFYSRQTLDHHRFLLEQANEQGG